jgi:hypothetical protein
LCEAGAKKERKLREKRVARWAKVWFIKSWSMELDMTYETGYESYRFDEQVLGVVDGNPTFEWSWNETVAAAKAWPNASVTIEEEFGNEFLIITFADGSSTVVGRPE